MSKQTFRSELARNTLAALAMLTVIAVVTAIVMDFLK